MLNKISVVHCKKTSEDFVYIGRPSPLGNPFKLEKGMKKGSTLEKYEDWLRERISRRDPKVCSELSRLYKLAKEDSLNLGCWCSPSPCHGDIIKKILEEAWNNSQKD